MLKENCTRIALDIPNKLLPVIEDARKQEQSKIEYFSLTRKSTLELILARALKKYQKED